MKRPLVLLCFFILIILIYNFSLTYSQNILESDSLGSFRGKIILKNSQIIESDYIKLLKDCVIFRNNTNSSIDTLKTNSVDFFRFNMGHYSLEYAGLGTLCGTAIILYEYFNLSMVKKNPIKPEVCLGVIGGGAFIGLIIGMVTHKHETFYISKNINVTFYNSSMRNSFIKSSDLITISFNY